MVERSLSERCFAMPDFAALLSYCCPAARCVCLLGAFLQSRRSALEEDVHILVLASDSARASLVLLLAAVVEALFRSVSAALLFFAAERRSLGFMSASLVK